MSRLYGIHAIRDVFDAHPAAIRVVLYHRHPDAETARFLDLVKASGIVLKEATGADLQTRAGGRGGISIAADLIIASPPTLASLSPADLSRPVIALDQVTDPHNLGAILRSSAAFGAQAIVVPKDHSAPLNDAAIRASAGAAAIVPILRVTNLARALGDLHESGFWCCALVSDGAPSIWSADLDVPLVLAFGAEGSGLRPLVRRACQLAVTIPSAGPLRSLNVSVATGVALAEVARRRIKPPESNEL